MPWVVSPFGRWRAEFVDGYDHGRGRGPPVVGAVAGVGRSVGQVLLDRGQERCDERLGLDLDLGLGVHAVVVAIGVVSALERALGEAGADGDPACLLYTSPSPRD